MASDIGDQNGIPLFNIGYECSGIKCIWQNSMPTNHWPKVYQAFHFITIIPFKIYLVPSQVPSKMAFWEQLNYIAGNFTRFLNLVNSKINWIEHEPNLFLNLLHFAHSARKYVHLLTRKDKRLVYIRPAIEFYNGRDFEKTEEIKMMSFYTTKKRFGAVRAGLPPNMMWACLNARLRDYDGTSSDENNLIYQAQTYNFVPDSDGVSCLTLKLFL